MSFPCTKCGCCCKKAGILAAFITDPQDPLFFPHKTDDTGRCEKLSDDNTCSIYEDRPLVCNFDKFLEKFPVNKEHFYKQNIQECNKMMDQDGAPKELRIPQ